SPSSYGDSSSEEETGDTHFHSDREGGGEREREGGGERERRIVAQTPTETPRFLNAFKRNQTPVTVDKEGREGGRERTDTPEEGEREAERLLGDDSAIDISYPPHREHISPGKEVPVVRGSGEAKAVAKPAPKHIPVPSVPVITVRPLREQVPPGNEVPPSVVVSSHVPVHHVPSDPSVPVKRVQAVPPVQDASLSLPLSQTSLSPPVSLPDLAQRLVGAEAEGRRETTALIQRTQRVLEMGSRGGVYTPLGEEYYKMQAKREMKHRLEMEFLSTLKEREREQQLLREKEAAEQREREKEERIAELLRAAEEREKKHKEELKALQSVSMPHTIPTAPVAEERHVGWHDHAKERETERRGRELPYREEILAHRAPGYYVEDEREWHGRRGGERERARGMYDERNYSPEVVYGKRRRDGDMRLPSKEWRRERGRERERESPVPMRRRETLGGREMRRERDTERGRGRRETFGGSGRRTSRERERQRERERERDDDSLMTTLTVDDDTSLTMDTSIYEAERDRERERERRRERRLVRRKRDRERESEGSRRRKGLSKGRREKERERERASSSDLHSKAPVEGVGDASPQSVKTPMTHKAERERETVAAKVAVDKGEIEREAELEVSERDASPVLSVPPPPIPPHRVPKDIVYPGQVSFASGPHRAKVYVMEETVTIPPPGASQPSASDARPVLGSELYSKMQAKAHAYAAVACDYTCQANRATYIEFEVHVSEAIDTCLGIARADSLDRLMYNNNYITTEGSYWWMVGNAKSARTEWSHMGGSVENGTTDPWTRKGGKSILGLLVDSSKGWLQLCMDGVVVKALQIEAGAEYVPVYSCRRKMGAKGALMIRSLDGPDLDLGTYPVMDWERQSR
ncbi:hypothetical protein KIPB_006031, partial [Kipferlia bialata]